MEIIVSGHHTEVPTRFRSHVEAKLAKLVQYDSRVQRVDVEVIHESNPRQSGTAERVEITVYGKGPVIRAEASAPDRYAALDAVIPKLVEQARRAHSRRKNRRMGRSHAHIPPDLAVWADPIPVPASPAPPALDAPADGEARPGATPMAEPVEIPLGDSPVVIREKTHVASPMTVEDAVYQMELVGHPFFLFVDADSGLPSVLYHRHGWTYGVIRVEAPVVA
ncbi:MAG: ribosome-associated translation inhibitor RaiA [Bifidobacteriaceae bacterium]|jgi:ribosomal subunit interface protein|nr:ribosome-associated translation inhibitor RaiA [Bifidobacteriaceae bacterium]